MGMNELVTAYGLAPHPEGGWFRETWRSPVQVATERGERPAGTSILYLVGQGAISRLHRLAWDEVWHWHRGDPLHLYLLGAGGVECRTLEPENPQVQVGAGTWFGAECAVAGGWSLAGCTMAPGFDAADFEMGRREELLADHPDDADLIIRLTAGKETP